MTLAEMLEMKKGVESWVRQEHPERKQPGVCILYQHDKDRVCVPPGWAHAVLNLQPNVKIAMDGVLWDEMPCYVLGRRDVLIPHLRKPGDDFGVISMRAWNVLTAMQP